jgi:hypothetical protein
VFLNTAYVGEIVQMEQCMKVGFVVHFFSLRRFFLVLNLFYMPLFFLGAQIPDWFCGESSGSTKDNPFLLPDAYLVSQQRNVCLLSHAD